MLPLAAAAVLAFAPLPIGSEVRPTTVRIGRASVVLQGHSDDPAAELAQARLMIEAQRIMIDRLGGGGTPPAFDELINELTAELEAAVRTIEAKGAEIDELEGDLHDTEAALDAALILLEDLRKERAPAPASTVQFTGRVVPTRAGQGAASSISSRPHALS